MNRRAAVAARASATRWRFSLVREKRPFHSITSQHANIQPAARVNFRFPMVFARGQRSRCRPCWSVRTLSVKSTSSVSSSSKQIDSLSEVGDPAIDLLNQETRYLLDQQQQQQQQQQQLGKSQSARADEHNMTVQLMKEWLCVPNVTKERAVENIEALFRHWLQHINETKEAPKTSLPFRLALEGWRRVENGTQCAQVLDEWGELLGGDLTLAPNLDAFHVVMDAYSKQSMAPLSQEAIQDEESAAPLTMVEDLLLLLQQWHTAGNVWARPTVETYSYVIQTLAQHILKNRNQQQPQIDDSHKQRILDLLQEMEQTYQKSSPKTKGPRDVYFLTKAFRDVVQVVAMEGRHNAVEAPADFNGLQLLQQLYQIISNEDLEAVHHATNPLPRCLLAGEDIDYFASDEQSSKHHYHFYKDDSLQHVLGQAYDIVLERLWVVLGKKDRNDSINNTASAQQIHQLVEQLEDLGASWSQLPFPKHYYVAIKAWAKTAKPSYPSKSSSSPDVQTDAEVHCENLLHQLEARHLGTTGNHDQDPRNNEGDVLHVSGTPYERLLWVLAQAGKGGRARDLLMHFMSLQAQGFVTPYGDMNPYWNHALNAYFREGRTDSVLKLWGEMQAAKIRPTLFTYSIVLRSLAQSSKPTAAPQAQAIWERMLKSDLRPTANHYGAVMAAWSRSRDKNAPRKAQAVLQKLEEMYSLSNNSHDLRPTPAHYTAVITAWGRSHVHDAASNAEKVFRTMCEHGESDHNFIPDIVSYSAMINAFSRAKSADAARKAQALLEEAEYLSCQDGRASMRPNKVVYTSVISAWTRSGAPDAPERAHEVFDHLIRAYDASGGDDSLLPDAYTYSSIIGAWANSRKKEAGDQAEALLDMMEEQRSKLQRGPVPNAIVFTNVIIAHWKSNKPEGAVKAQEILERMIKSFDDGNLSSKPDATAYTCVIQAWARSTVPDKSDKAWKMLQRMLDLYESGNLDVRPNYITYSAVLNACAYTRGNDRDRERATKIALMILAEMQKRGEKPTHITFRTLLLVFAKQVKDPRERARLASVAFERCCQEGQVDQSVIGTLRMNIPSLYEKLPRNAEGVLDIPLAWSKNVDLNNA